VLAAAGLLDGVRATTHCRAASELAALYPRVAVDPNVLYVDGEHGSTILSPMLNAFGLVAVSLTLLFYALEDRSPIFVLAFAGGCLASAVYGFLQGAWPFGLIEIAWTVVAIRRWRRIARRGR